MNRKQHVLAVLLKTFPAGSSLALKPESLELKTVFEEQESYAATLFWRDGIAVQVRVMGDVELGLLTKWVAVMKQDGAGSPDLRLNDPDFRSRKAISDQAKKLTFGRPLYVLYFTLVNL